MKTNIKLLLLILTGLAGVTATRGQVASNPPYTLDQSVIAGGGGTSAAGNQFSVTGAIGQSITDSSGASPFSVKSGFFTAPPVSAPTAAAVTVSGRAMTATGRGIRNVRIQMTDAGGTTRTARTSAFGYYRFADVNTGETYILTARGKAYSFNQPTQVVSINQDETEINFVAYPSEWRR